MISAGDGLSGVRVCQDVVFRMTGQSASGLKRVSREMTLCSAAATEDGAWDNLRLLISGHRRVPGMKCVGVEKKWPARTERVSFWLDRLVSWLKG